MTNITIPELSKVKSLTGDQVRALILFAAKSNVAGFANVDSLYLSTGKVIYRFGPDGLRVHTHEPGSVQFTDVRYVKDVSISVQSFVD